jgi:hypothetical protein
MPGPERLIIDHVQERHPALGAEILPVGLGHQGRDGDDEPHPVDRGDHPAAQGPGEADADLLGDQVRVGRACARDEAWGEPTCF